MWNVWGRGAYSVSVGEPEGKRQFERYNSRWKDNMGRNEVGWWFLDWVDVAEDKKEWRGGG